MAQHFSSFENDDLIRLLQHDAVGVLPTDTVYGLVARAESKEAIERLYRVKDRPVHPGTIIAASPEQLLSLGFPAEEVAAARKYWPAPLSVVLDASNVASYLKAERTSLAARIPDDEALRVFLQQVGPLMTTSANAPEQPTASDISAALAYFYDDIDFYVDGGDLSQRQSSTIAVVASDGTLDVIRRGAFIIDASSIS